MSRQTHKYCRQNGRNKAFYWLDDKRITLPGLYGSPESLKAYHDAMALLNETKANDVAGIKLPQLSTQKINQLSVAELVDAFLIWGETHYVKYGKTTGSLEDYELASRPVTDLYGHLQVNKFTQRELISIRNLMNDKCLSRKTINDRLCRIKRIFNWGVSEGHLSFQIAKNLEYVENIRKGRSKAPERPKVKNVPDFVVDATREHLPPVLRDMVDIQRISGMRPGEMFTMTWGQINTSDDVWIYTPSHKTEHHDIDRYVPLNKKCQAILTRYKDTPPDQIIFSPKRTVREQSEMRAAQRKTKVQPSQVKRKKHQQVRKENLVSETYNRHSYRNAIQRAVTKCNKVEAETAKKENREPLILPKWFPYQLRHSAASEVANILSKEDAKLLLSHRNIGTTDIYIHEQIEKLKAIARKMEEKS